MASELAHKLQKRAIQEFMAVLILNEMGNRSLSGYDVLGLIYRKYGFLMSSGTIYSLLYSLERDGWIKGTAKQRKRVYQLTEKGTKNIGVITKADSGLQDFLRNISLLNSIR